VVDDPAVAGFHIGGKPPEDPGSNGGERSQGAAVTRPEFIAGTDK